MQPSQLGEFEEIVLLTVAILNGTAYSINVIDEIQDRIQRTVSLGAVQTVLKRLEDKSLVKSDFGEVTSVRGGKRKRLYEITAEGRQLLRQIHAQRNSLFNAIPKVVFQFS